MHFPIKFTNKGSIPSTEHFTLNLMSLSTTFGWKVTSNRISSWAFKWPFYGVIVKYFPQNFVSHSNFDEISPKFDNCIVFVIFEFITTVPKPTVSSINFIYMPCAVVNTFNSFLFYWLSTILYRIYALNGLILMVGLNDTYKSYF